VAVISDYLLDLGCPPGSVERSFGYAGGRCIDGDELAGHSAFCEHDWYPFVDRPTVPRNHIAGLS
jgi:hypothetical protein